MDSTRIVRQKPKVTDLELFAALVAVGAGTWLAFVLLNRGREAWDTGAYYFIGLPFLAALAALYGWRAPRRAWCWPLALMIGQAIAGVTLAKGDIDLWPISILALALFSIPSVLAALIAARLRLRRV